MPPSSSSHEDESPPSLSDDAIEEEVTKLRISLVLSPSYVRGRENDLRVDALRLPADPIAVPATIRKRGLSAVVNHLLDRRVPTENDDDDDDDDDDDEDKLPAIPFDFLLNDKLLRLPLDSAARKEGLSTERALVVQYFPARPPPSRVGGEETEALPDWITAMDYRCRRQDGVGGTLFVGGADGIVRTFVSSPPPPPAAAADCSDGRAPRPPTRVPSSASPCPPPTRTGARCWSPPDPWIRPSSPTSSAPSVERRGRRRRATAGREERRSWACTRCIRAGTPIPSAASRCRATARRWRAGTGTGVCRSGPSRGGGGGPTRPPTTSTPSIRGRGGGGVAPSPSSAAAPKEEAAGGFGR